MKENLMRDYIDALRSCKGYEWINKHGYDLDFNDLIRIIKELDYAISEDALIPKNIYNTAADELTNWYLD